MTDPVLALDIGGTKLAAGLVAASGEVLHAVRAPTPTGREAIWSGLLALVGELGPGSVAGVGIGCGGPMQWPVGLVSPLNIPDWREFPLRDRVAGEFPDVPVRLHNDAACVAAGEHWRGAGRGHANVMGMVVSTGVGGGLVFGGRLVDGGTGNAGHIGHVVVDPAGPPCACGGRGCLEAIARGPALVTWAREQGWQGGAVAAELAAAAARGEAVAEAAFARAGRALGTAIASAAALCDLDLVVVGGGVSQAGEPLFGPLRAAFDEHAGMAFTRRCQVVSAELGPQAGLVGAAALLFAGDHYWSAE